MKQLVLGALCGVLASAMAFSAASAQSDATQTQAANAQVNSELMAWLRLRETERRCGTLLFVELRAIEDNVRVRIEQTRTYTEAMAAAGTPRFEARLDAHREFAEALTAQMQAETAETSCALNENPLFNEARRLYMRDLLRFTIIENSANNRANEASGYDLAYTQLAQFLRQLYGDSFDTVGAEIITELNAIGPTALATWDQFEPYLRDVIWELKLGSNGFKMGHHRTDPGWYQFFQNGQPASAFGLMGQPARGKVRDGEGHQTIEVLRAEGRMADDRVVITYVFTNTEATPPALRAVIYTPNEAGSAPFQAEDFRDTALAFEAETLPAGQCPADACLVFPAALSEEIRARQEGGAFFTYELYVGIEDALPPASSSRTTNRERFTPPRFE